MTSTISFPAIESQRASQVSLLSRHAASALEVCELVYGTADSTSWDALERFYESGAVYENPFVTATSRRVTRDLFSLYHQISHLDLPKPLPTLCHILRTAAGRPSNLSGNSCFPIIRTWTEMGDVCESESFDHHKRAVVEHILHVLFLPDIHDNTADNTRTHDGNEPHSSHHHDHSGNSLHRPLSHLSVSSDLSGGSSSRPTLPHSPALPVFGTDLTVPSPLHFKFHILTKLEFNEQGRIVHHRDFWDISNVMQLFPGGPLSYWIGTRLAAQGLSMASRLGQWALGGVGALSGARLAEETSNLTRNQESCGGQRKPFTR